MVVYTCSRCGYSCKNKSYYKKHLLRKVICEPNITNVPISELYDDMYGKGRYAIDINMHAKKNVTAAMHLRLFRTICFLQNDAPANTGA